ncbi:MAG: hypothetical protein RR840_01555 [Clostridium sp.]
MCRILSIYYKDREGKSNYPSKVEVIKDIGIKGDIKSAKKGRNIAFIFSEDLGRLDLIDGLCTKRFKANLTIEGRININIGDILLINGVSIIVTEIGKRCFDGCNIEATNRCKCPLKNIFYGDVLENGEILIDSIVKPISTD